MKKLKTAIYGVNGHQIWDALKTHPRILPIAAAGVPEERLRGIPAYDGGEMRTYGTLEELLEKESPEMICLCSPRRRDQAKDAILCLEKGVAVYAEKPAALSEEELDGILAVSARTGVPFHEIADTAFFEPYYTAGKLIREGKIGEVVQVYVQKSYPQYFPNRPEDEDVDGGLTRQGGIHAMRFVEHTVGLRVVEATAMETQNGNRGKEGLRMASSWLLRLENGAVASACINYLNPMSFGLWGNETLRVFGTKGMLEITDGARHTHLYTEEGDMGEIDVSHSDCVPFFDSFVDHLLTDAPMPMTLEEELHPLRSVIRVKEAVR